MQAGDTTIIAVVLNPYGHGKNLMHRSPAHDEVMSLTREKRFWAGVRVDHLGGPLMEHSVERSTQRQSRFHFETQYGPLGDYRVEGSTQLTEVQLGRPVHSSE